MAKKTTTPQSAEESHQASLDVTFTKSLNDIPIYYSNQARVRTTVHDMQIIFGQLAEQTEKSAATVPQTAVYLSVAHAKRLVTVMAQQLEFYESKFGKIPGY